MLARRQGGFGRDQNDGRLGRLVGALEPSGFVAAECFQQGVQLGLSRVKNISENIAPLAASGGPPKEPGIPPGIRSSPGRFPAFLAWTAGVLARAWLATIMERPARAGR
jgi:hypothetical protein